jgi:hypothetical protein
MLFLHHKHCLAFLEQKQPEALKAYASTEFQGAKHHAQELLQALGNAVSNGTPADSFLGTQPAEAFRAAFFLGQLAYLAKGPAELQTTDVLRDKNFLNALCTLSIGLGREGFAMFGPATSHWLFQHFEGMQKLLKQNPG